MYLLLFRANLFWLLFWSQFYFGNFLFYLNQFVDVNERVHGLALIRGRGCLAVPLALAPSGREVHLGHGQARTQQAHGQQHGQGAGHRAGVAEFWAESDERGIDRVQTGRRRAAGVLRDFLLCLFFSRRAFTFWKSIFVKNKKGNQNKRTRRVGGRGCDGGVYTDGGSGRDVETNVMAEALRIPGFYTGPFDANACPAVELRRAFYHKCSTRLLFMFETTLCLY